MVKCTVQVIVHDEDHSYPPMSWWERRQHAWRLVCDNVSARGQKNIHRVWMNTYENLKYLVGIGDVI